MYGCDKFCTYCIFLSRGKNVQVPEDILEEVRDLAARGYQEITLLGQNVNSYEDLDLDYSYDLGDLMSVFQRIFRVRLLQATLGSQTTDRLLATGENLMPHIHLCTVR